MSQKKREKGFSNQYVNVVLKDGILIANYVDNVHITLPIAKQIVQDRLDFSQNRSYPMLGDVSRGVKMDVDAKIYFNSQKSIQGISSGAFLISSRIERFIGNTWFKIAKPPIPFKLFTDKSEALIWLEKFKYMN